VEFSYRLMAKRLGYEEQRLARAPWADDDPNLYPEKRAAWEAMEMLPEAEVAELLLLLASEPLPEALSEKAMEVEEIEPPAETP
jgi:hypothetical protein